MPRPTQITEIKCSHCGEVKPRNQFHYSNGRIGGKTCDECKPKILANKAEKKQCIQCGLFKSLDSFHYQNGRIGGKTCDECKKKCVMCGKELIQDNSKRFSKFCSDKCRYDSFLKQTNESTKKRMSNPDYHANRYKRLKERIAKGNFTKYESTQLSNCDTCGQSKPKKDFLTKGGTYSSTCISCRSLCRWCKKTIPENSSHVFYCSDECYKNSVREQNKNLRLNNKEYFRHKSYEYFLKNRDEINQKRRDRVANMSFEEKEEFLAKNRADKRRMIAQKLLAETQDVFKEFEDKLDE